MLSTVVFETANAIHNPAYTDAAITVAKYAREYEQAIELIQTHTEESLRLDREVLSDVVNANGNLTRALRECVSQMTALLTLNRETQEAGEKNVKAMRNQVDAFSSLKGMTGPKAYPTKWEIFDQKNTR